MSQEFALEEIKKHNQENDAWIIIKDQVFDVTKFLADHPGGKKILLQAAGTDATKKFDMFHKPATLAKYAPALKIGVVKGSAAAKAASAPKQAPPAASAPSSSAVVPAKKGPAPVCFGEMVPYGDPSWYQEWHSPYYNDSHKRFRAAVREFVEAEVIPYAHEWDEAKKLPKSFFQKAADFGILGAVIGAPWRKEYCGDKLPGGIKPEEFDYFHELILTDEIGRAGAGGIQWGLAGGLSIGLPPIIHFGSQYLKDKVCKPCLQGQKFICLAITEPTAGSDVAGLKTTAVKTPDGKHYIVNGQKKWITNGVFADYFTVAVRTGGEGQGGVSLLLVERGPGVTTKQMNCMGVWASGTTYITFEDVKVPVENLIGKEGQGFKYIMHNFNHERWGTCVQSVRFARVCLEESMRYAFKRKTFGKFLIEHPVIRLKLAHMARQVEATQAQLENVTYQMNKMSFADAQRVLGGPIALLKAQCTTVFEYCAREAAQIFGGLAYTRGGQGEKVERLYREVRAYAIPAGSEEIMLDLGIRQAIKDYQKKASKL